MRISSTSADCPRDFKVCEFTPARAFNLMFKTHAGPVEDEGAVAYLRPETAQGMFIELRQRAAVDSQEAAVRHRPGRQVASATRSRRGNFVFRTREFEQMELEFFVPPDDAPKWYEFWCAERLRWYTELGIPSEHVAAAGRTMPTSCRTTRPARPTSSSSTRGVGASSKASRTAPTTT